MKNLNMEKSEISLSKTTPIDFKEQKKSYYAGVI